MVDVVVDFISLIKDVRGNQFDVNGLPVNGKWKDIKDWHTEVGLIAYQVVIDVADVGASKDAAEAALAGALGIEAASAASAAEAVISENAANVSALAAAASEAQTTADVAETALTVAGTLQVAAAVTAAKIAAGVSATTAGDYSAQAQVSANSASLSSTAAGVAKAKAAGSANEARISEDNALDYQENVKVLSLAVEADATAAADSEISAHGSELAALAAADTANKWSSEFEDVLVDDGVNPKGFSAYHWAQKAGSSAGGVTAFSDLSDVPVDYTGHAGNSLKINTAENAIEFVQSSGADVGLGNVDNTSDADKPLSTAAATALGLKADKTAINSLGTRVTILEKDTAGITNHAAGGSDPDRVAISKVVYSTASQTLGAVEPAALTRHDLVASMLAAETIGAY